MCTCTRLFMYRTLFYYIRIHENRFHHIGGSIYCKMIWFFSLVHSHFLRTFYWCERALFSGFHIWKFYECPRLCSKMKFISHFKWKIRTTANMEWKATICYGKREFGGKKMNFKQTKNWPIANENYIWRERVLGWKHDVVWKFNCNTSLFTEQTNKQKTTNIKNLSLDCV